MYTDDMIIAIEDCSISIKADFIQTKLLNIEEDDIDRTGDFGSFRINRIANTSFSKKLTYCFTFKE